MAKPNPRARTILSCTGSLPKCAGQAARPLLGGAAGGRSLGSIYQYPD